MQFSSVVTLLFNYLRHGAGAGAVMQLWRECIGCIINLVC